MLLGQTVAPATLALLKDLCKEPLFQTFALGGGTNIALQSNRFAKKDFYDMDALLTDYFAKNAGYF